MCGIPGACLAIRREVFETLNGFDVEFPVNYNDVDLCLRARQVGYEVVFEPEAKLRHDECATRASGTRVERENGSGSAGGELLDQPDPYFTRYLDGEELRLVWP